jgi:hypothetical protein
MMMMMMMLKLSGHPSFVGHQDAQKRNEYA